jgi:hypothetical protein
LLISGEPQAAKRMRRSAVKKPALAPNAARTRVEPVATLPGRELAAGETRDGESFTAFGRRPRPDGFPVEVTRMPNIRRSSFPVVCRIAVEDAAPSPSTYSTPTLVESLVYARDG